MLTYALNRWIKIEVGTPGKNAQTGTPEETYALLKYTWAGVEFTGGKMFADANGENVLSDVIITLRYGANINYKCRIFYNNQYYKITHIELIGRNEGLRLRCIMFVAE